MFGKYRIIIIVAAVLGVAFVIYMSVSKAKPEEDLLLTDTVEARSPTDIVGAEIISALNQIESLRLSRNIFSSPVYQTLKDRSQEITPEAVGKKNPFDPINSNAPAKETVPIVKDTPAATKNSVIKPPAQPVI